MKRIHPHTANLDRFAALACLAAALCIIAPAARAQNPQPVAAASQTANQLSGNFTRRDVVRVLRDRDRAGGRRRR